MTIRNLLIITYSVLTSYTALYAQRNHYFLLELTAKDTLTYTFSKPELYLSPKALQRRAKYQIPLHRTDLPVDTSTLRVIHQSGFNIVARSKWLNAVVVQTFSKRSTDSLSRIAGVKSVTYLGARDQGRSRKHIEIPDINRQLSNLEQRVNGNKEQADSSFYGRSFKQIHQLKIDSLHAYGFDGKGIQIAIVDAGFANMNILNYSFKLFGKATIVSTRDFVDLNTDVYSDDDHGLAVLSCLATYQPNRYVGASPAARYMLLRSEDALHEILLEEILWVVAAEFADSSGADILHSSLGYSEFDDPEMNHNFKELNGKTTFISRGAAIAVSKGIIVVSSAGNEGNKDWRFVAAPADVEEVITVGGVDAEGRLALFSSQGPTADKRIKPDVMAMGEKTAIISPTNVIYPANGTSYAAPLISGVAACLLQADSLLTPQQLMRVLKISSTRYNKPDKFFGYGIPDALLAYKYIAAARTSESNAFPVLVISMLADKYIHLAAFAQQSQKIEVHIKDEQGKLLHKQLIKLKPSTYIRQPLVKLKDKKAKALTATVTWGNQTKEFPIVIDTDYEK